MNEAYLDITNDSWPKMEGGSMADKLLGIHGAGGG